MAEKGFLDFAAGYDVNTNLPIDRRLVLTKEQMKTINDDNMPENYFCICKSSDTDPDNGKMFVYIKTNKDDENTGKFRLYNSANDIQYEYTENDCCLKIFGINPK